MGKGTGVDNTNRRTWDKEEYAERAAEREELEKEKEENPMDAKRRRRWERDPLHQGLIVQRSHLKARDFQLDLTSRLGKTQVITLNTPLNQQAGYYCSVCDCILRDSQSYLDHINGKWHNRALGMSMRVERSTVDQVKKRLEMHKDGKKRGHDRLGSMSDRLELEGPVGLLESGDAVDEKDSKRRKKEQNDDEDDDGEGLDSEAAALMGFSGFGGSKK
ncbi:hypothetical protein BSKO_10434 [Bryopsis sp. KO-2023]|nr:hypothetical protein BSKO_10434 [Bryopsis sp. KO-2023]